MWKNSPDEFRAYICEKQNVCFDIPSVCEQHQRCETSHSGDYRCLEDVEDVNAGDVDIVKEDPQVDPCAEKPCGKGLHGDVRTGPLF